MHRGNMTNEQKNEGMTKSIFSTDALSGKVALITGGAYGIGFAIATAMAEAGATIVFNCSRQSTLDRGIRAYHEAGIDCRGYLCDVTDESAVGQMIADIDKTMTGVDILVNNAGVILRKGMTDMSAVEFRHVVDVDLVGPWICAKAVIPGMIGKGGGKIINICSLMSELGREQVSGYASAKGGLRMLTRNICAEYGRYNIQCNAIAPGYIATEQTEPLRQPKPDGGSSDFDVFVKQRTPSGRWGTPDDIKGAALFLASAGSDYVNGQMIFVDGGLTASLGSPHD